MEWVARRGRRADGKEQARRIPVPQWRDNERATQPAALLPRALQGCVDFGAGLRCSLGRDRCGYRHCATRLGQRQNPQQRDPLQYFNSLLASDTLYRRSQFTDGPDQLTGFSWLVDDPIDSQLPITLPIRGT